MLQWILLRVNGPEIGPIFYRWSIDCGDDGYFFEILLKWNNYILRNIEANYFLQSITYYYYVSNFLVAQEKCTESCKQEQESQPADVGFLLHWFYCAPLSCRKSHFLAVLINYSYLILGTTNTVWSKPSIIFLLRISWIT